ncbi:MULTISPECIES: MBL fold metallo-hydrolase [unclassified Streptomyces]|uniref:MBL fold metallo-hydrolase n=1 Tax=unclassified Streptomyces TaxID=2593676 RepID=UPI001BE8E538|nr:MULTISPECIES: MBL fold metallo-hydrolase [unclassified Streptomyces]MBT2407634.1 MBL fold metallo-hydrolase [Streptomyces sp. ISL-21]MBT2454511.1 MBL fold metallo-hydrolase [Streptomyces sp. ISL-86]MBT2611628.1 MBL fold metallo-hydrolase [Streptomyces sp. ISL-87]
MKFTATHIGTATVLLEIGGVRLLTDPVFDPAPAEYRHDPVVLRSTAGPAVAIEDLPAVDAILLSHDDHPDNLDATGRTLLTGRPVLTTESGAGRLGGEAVGLAPWSSYELTVRGTTLRITATPGVHGPVGDVIGFVIEAGGETEALYISGDTVYVDALDEIARRFTVGTALLHLGAARIAAFGDGRLITMDAAQGAALTRSLGAHTAVPVHYTSWEHFTEDREQITAAFDAAGLAHRLHWLAPGARETLG